MLLNTHIKLGLILNNRCTNLFLWFNCRTHSGISVLAHSFILVYCITVFMLTCQNYFLMWGNSDHNWVLKCLCKSVTPRYTCHNTPPHFCASAGNAGLRAARDSPVHTLILNNSELRMLSEIQWNRLTDCLKNSNTFRKVSKCSDDLQMMSLH